MLSTLTFCGGVGMVTGANFLLETGNTKILVDCGMIQGTRFESIANEKPFPYQPSEIDALLVTHAHADHIGRIPKLVHDGFAGTIFSTPPTKALAELMLHDAFNIMRMEAKQYGNAMLYDEDDIADALALWNTNDYEKPFPLRDNVIAHFTNAGHILGSAFVHLARNGKTIVFTGDIGNIPQPLLAAPTFPINYNYMVMESVYGDRQHEQVDERSELLAGYIQKTITQNGTLIIPAFSLERTQGMLLEINNLVESGVIEPIPTFLDSPLAIAVTSVYKQYPEYLRADIRTQINKGDDIFAFPKLKLTRTKEDSREISAVKGAKIIIAGSGMSHGGRIRGHEKRYLEDSKTILLLVGYQSVGSLGRRLADGAKHVRIDDTEVRVRASVAQIHGYSGHADRNQLVDFVAHGGEHAEEIFVTMGEERSSLFLVQRLRDYLGVHATAPSLDENVTIDF